MYMILKRFWQSDCTAPIICTVKLPFLKSRYINKKISNDGGGGGGGENPVHMQKNVEKRTKKWTYMATRDTVPRQLISCHVTEFPFYCESLSLFFVRSFLFIFFNFLQLYFWWLIEEFSQQNHS